MKFYFSVMVSVYLLICIVAVSQDIPSSKLSSQVVESQSEKLAGQLAAHGSGLALGDPVFIRIFKDPGILEVWVMKDDHFRLFKTYEICTYGGRGIGPKTSEGDGKAPEGFYFVKPNQLNPYSNYYLAFNLGYPNQYDRVHKRTGSALMIHGSCVSIGCFAMTDEIIEEIYTMVYQAFINGQAFIRVHIFPFKMTEEHMLKHNKSEDYSFWKNLKEGYDAFEKTHIPPNVNVFGRKYVFN